MATQSPNVFQAQQQQQQQQQQDGIWRPDSAPSTDPVEMEKNAKLYESQFMLGVFAAEHKNQISSSTNRDDIIYTREQKNAEGWNAEKIDKAIKLGNFISKMRNPKGKKVPAPQSVNSIEKKLTTTKLVYIPYIPRQVYGEQKLTEWLIELGKVWDHYPAYRNIIYPNVENVTTVQLQSHLLNLIRRSMSKICGHNKMYVDFVNSPNVMNIRLVGNALAGVEISDIARMANDPDENLLIKTLTTSGVALGTVPLSPFIRVHFAVWLMSQFSINATNIKTDIVQSIIRDMKVISQEVESRILTEMPVQLYVRLSAYLNASNAESRPKKRFYVISSGVAIEHPSDLNIVKARPDFLAAVMRAVESSNRYFGSIPNDFDRIDITNFPHENFTLKKGDYQDLSKRYVFLDTIDASYVNPDGSVITFRVPSGLIMVKPYTSKAASGSSHERVVVGGVTSIVTATMALRVITNSSSLEDYRAYGNKYKDAFASLKKRSKAADRR